MLSIEWAPRIVASTIVEPMKEILKPVYLRKLQNNSLFVVLVKEKTD
jgi:hypothetical protein